MQNVKNRPGLRIQLLGEKDLAHLVVGGISLFTFKSLVIKREYWKDIEEAAEVVIGTDGLTVFRVPAEFLACYGVDDVIGYDDVLLIATDWLADAVNQYVLWMIPFGV